MSIPSIAGAARVSSSTAERAAASPPPARAGGIDSAHNADGLDLPPAPRFPWLSRLSQQLESAARQKPAFQPAPILGDHVDKSA